MTKWTVKLSGREWEVGAFVQLSPVSAAPEATQPPAPCANDEGEYTSSNWTAGSFRVEEVKGEEMLVCDLLNQSYWWLSPATKDEEASEPAQASPLSKRWGVRRPGKAQKTARELRAMILNQSLDMIFYRLDVRSEPDVGWGAYIAADPVMVAEYQAHVDRLTADLRTKYDLKR